MMQKNQTWWDYVQQVSAGDSATEIARRINVDRSAITRWKKGSGADPRFAVSFARAYGRPVTEALAACKLITEAEAGVQIARAHAGDLTNRELIAELDRRLIRGNTRPEDGHTSDATASDSATPPNTAPSLDDFFNAGPSIIADPPRQQRTESSK